ncbi:MAG: glycosyltransferase [Limnothrix sp. RL_2_0]|nr:glycosyltransferase [Limnothrix sp. RL_2_0]
MNNLPKISIITPSYQQGIYIEDTIVSVISQNYPNLEYIIIDGGSTDQTLDIIKKYEEHITYWVSEADQGQAHALNKGLNVATGEIIAYINSDDYYAPNTFHRIAKYFTEYPETDLLYGICTFVDEKKQLISEHQGGISNASELFNIWEYWWSGKQIIQPETFWSRQIFEKVGMFNEDLYFVMDYEYWCRLISAGAIIKSIDETIACFRVTPTQKTNDKNGVRDEILDVLKKFLWSELPLDNKWTLQGNWLYQVILTPKIDEYVQSGDSVFLRWLKTALLIIRYPKLFFSSFLKKRIFYNVLSKDI